MRKMKIIFYILLFSLISCAKITSQNQVKKNQTKKDKIVEIDPETKYWDSICRIETKNAVKDINENNLTYSHSFGMVVQYRSNEEMNKLLSKYKIKVDSISYYCTIPGELQKCYAHKMRQEIDKRFGKKFIDSLRTIAEKQYVKNNPNKTYKFEECDKLSRYPNDKNYLDFFKNYKNNFFITAEYPKDFELRKEKDSYSWISADFILHKDGTVTNIDIELTFQNKKNYKYSSYFTTKLKEFILNTKWIPAKSTGEIVTSKVPLTIHFN
jgi:predicted nucleic acid-binding protein